MSLAARQKNENCFKIHKNWPKIVRNYLINTHIVKKSSKLASKIHYKIGQKVKNYLRNTQKTYLSEVIYTITSAIKNIISLKKSSKFASKIPYNIGQKSQKLPRESSKIPQNYRQYIHYSISQKSVK